VCPCIAREQRTIAVVRSKVGDTCTQIFHITTSLQKAPRQEVVSRDRDSSIVQLVGSVTGPGADLGRATLKGEGANIVFGWPFPCV
jgi:hypothetical protein